MGGNEATCSLMTVLWLRGPWRAVLWCDVTGAPDWIRVLEMSFSGIHLSPGTQQPLQQQQASLRSSWEPAAVRGPVETSAPEG